MITAFLLACLKNDLSGGGGGGAFSVDGVNLTQKQKGTSCSNPLKLNVSLVYTGSASGKTVTIQRSWDGGDYTVIDSGLDPTADFPYPMDALGYWDKFGRYISQVVTVTDDSDATNTATSAAYTTTFIECGQ